MVTTAIFFDRGCASRTWPKLLLVVKGIVSEYHTVFAFVPFISAFEARGACTVSTYSSVRAEWLFQNLATVRTGTIFQFVIFSYDEVLVGLCEYHDLFWCHSEIMQMGNQEITRTVFLHAQDRWISYIGLDVFFGAIFAKRVFTIETEHVLFFVVLTTNYAFDSFFIFGSTVNKGSA
jgi:hypothetical protein